MFHSNFIEIKFSSALLFGGAALLLAQFFYEFFSAVHLFCLLFEPRNSELKVDSFTFSRRELCARELANVCQVSFMHIFREIRER